MPLVSPLRSKVSAATHHTEGVRAEVPLRVGEAPSALVEATGNRTLDRAFRGEGGPLGPVVAAEWALQHAGLSPSAPNSNTARLARLAARPSQDPSDRDSVARAALALIETSHGHRLPAEVTDRLASVLGTGPADTRTRQVLASARVHTDASAGRAAQQVGARAFALGTDVYFAPGTFRPGTPHGDELLAHELVHVLQHAEGRLPTGPAGTVSVSRPSDAHEREAVARASTARTQLHAGTDPVLTTIVGDIARSLGISAPEVHTGVRGRQRARAAGSRGVMENGAVFVDDSALDPTSAEGRQLVAHELVHVAQQRLPAANAETGGWQAEHEAQTLAPSLAKGHTQSVRCGLPTGHVAAENAIPTGKVDINRDLVLEQAVADMEAALAELTDSFAYMELESSVGGGATTPEETNAESGTAGGTESQQGETAESQQGETAESQDAEPQSAESQNAESSPQLDSAAALDGMREEAAYPTLVGHGAMIDHGVQHPIVEDLRAAFADLFATAEAHGLHPEALALLRDAIEADAVEQPPHDAMVRLDALITEWPLDPLTLVPELALLQDRPEEAQAPDEATCSTEPEESPAPVPVEMATLQNPVTDQPDPGGPLRTLDVAAERAETLDGSFQAAADFSAVAEDGVGLHLDRLPQIGEALADGVLDGLIPGVMNQLFDTLVLERLGILIDVKLLPALLKNVGLRAAPKLAKAGPILGLVPRVMAVLEEGSIWGFVAPERQAFYDGVTDLNEAHEAIHKAMEAEGIDRAPHLVRALAETYEVLGDTAAFVGGAAGLLAGILAAGGFVAGLVTGGAATPFVAALTPVIQSLAGLATLCVPVTMYTWSVSTVLHSVAAAIVDEDQLDESLKAVSDQAKAASEQAGGFLADKVGGQAADHMYSKVADRINGTGPAAPGPTHSAPPADGAATAHAMAAAQADRIDRSKAVIAKAEALDGSQAPKKKETSGDSAHTDTTPDTTVQKTVRALTDGAIETAQRVRSAAQQAHDAVSQVRTRIEGCLTHLRATVLPSPADVAAAQADVVAVSHSIAAAKTAIDSTRATEQALQQRTVEALRAYDQSGKSKASRDAMGQQLDQLYAAQESLRSARRHLTDRLTTLQDATQRASDLRAMHERWATSVLAGSDDGPDTRRSGSGSASETGGLGSTLKSLYEAIRDMEDNCRGAQQAAEARAAALDALVALVDGVDLDASGEEASQDRDAVAVFMATAAPEGGAELAEDLHATLQTRDQAAELCGLPTVRPDTLVDPIERANTAQQDFYVASIHAYLLGGVQAAITDLAEHHPGATDTSPDAIALDAFAQSRADAATASRSAHDALSSTTHAQPELPEGATAALAEGRNLATSIADSVQGADPAATEPPQDLDVVLEEAGTRTEETLADIEHQSTVLDAQHTEAVRMRDDAETQHQALAADHAHVQSTEAQVATHRADMEAEAAGHAAAAGADAQAATDGLSELRDWQVDADRVLLTPVDRSGP